MSTCIRGGVRYKRHAWEKQIALADVITCEHCGQVKGGVFEQRDAQSADEGTGNTISCGNMHEVLRTDGGVQLQPGDSGAGGDSTGVLEA
jgi:hypothetical protein